jgi:hypothetical protein
MDYVFELHLVLGTLKTLAQLNDDETFCQFYKRDKIIVFDETRKEYLKRVVPGLHCAPVTHMVKRNMFYPKVHYKHLRDYLGSCAGFFELFPSRLFYIKRPRFYGAIDDTRFYANNNIVVFLKSQ